MHAEDCGLGKRKGRAGNRAPFCTGCGGERPALFLGRVGGRDLGGFFNLGHGHRALPCGLAAGFGRGLFAQESGKVETRLGGGDTHGCVLSGNVDRIRGPGEGSGRGTTSAGRRGPCAPHPDDLPAGDRRAGGHYALFGGGKIGGWGGACRWGCARRVRRARAPTGGAAHARPAIKTVFS